MYSYLLNEQNVFLAVMLRATHRLSYVCMYVLCMYGHCIVVPITVNSPWFLSYLFLHDALQPVMTWSVISSQCHHPPFMVHWSGFLTAQWPCDGQCDKQGTSYKVFIRLISKYCGLSMILFLILVIQSGYNFAQGMTAKLSCPMQNGDLIWCEMNTTWFL